MEGKRRKLTIEEMKKLSVLIIEKLKKEEYIYWPIKIHPIVWKEFYHTTFFKNNFKEANNEEKIELLKIPINCMGLNNSTTDEIFIFLGIFLVKNIFSSSAHQLVDFLELLHHEFAHSLQKLSNGKYSYFEKICIEVIEFIIIKYNPIHYSKYYDNYFIELDADLYAINKTAFFLKKYEEIYLQELEYIEIKRIYYHFQFKNYDFDKMFSIFYKIYISNSKRIYQDSVGLAHTFFDIYFNQGTSHFKRIEEIRKSPFSLDQKCFNYIITSSTYIKQLSKEELTDEELSILISAIQYRIQEEIEKKEYNQELIGKEIINENELKEIINIDDEKIRHLYSLSEEIKATQAKRKILKR